MGKFWSFVSAGLVPLLFAAAPATVNYELQSFGFGNGGGTTSSATYSINGIAGEQNGLNATTATYTAEPGLIATQMANVPGAPTFTNPSSWYNKLHFVLDDGDNPTDATFALAISTDSFATTQYVQNDTTVGSALGPEDFQTYATWGSGSGADVIGLLPNTTYYLKVKAARGGFTESGWGPVASVATSDLALTFDIDVAPTDTTTSAPYLVAMGSLTPGSVTDSTDKVWFSLDTNALSGGRVYIVSQNTGLKSTVVNYTISSQTGDLSSLGEGFGAQASSATQSAGGPFASDSPYNGASQNVGIIDTTYRSMFSTSAPVTAGRSSFVLKAKAASMTPAANDYAELYTAVASASF